MSASQIDNAPPVEHGKRHEQKPATTPSQGDFDAQGFGEAAAALIRAGAAPSGGLAEVQVRQLIAWATAAQRLITEPDFERLRSSAMKLANTKSAFMKRATVCGKRRGLEPSA
jgi:hypothetical protein